MTKTKLTLAAGTLAVLMLAPLQAAAECSWGKYDQTAMSCAEGSTWDADQRTCVPNTTS